MLLIHTETILIRQAVRKILGNARTQLARLRKRRVRFKRYEVKSTEPHAELDPVAARPNASDDFAKDAGAVFKRAAVFAGPRVRPEKLVQQVAVTMFEVHEVGAHVPCNLRRRDVAFDQPLDFIVGKNLFIARDLEFLVEDRMAIGHPRLHADFVIRFAEAARVRELKTDEQIVRRAITLLVRFHEDFANLREVLFVLLDDDELIWIGPAIRPHGHCLTAVNQLGPALAETLPAPAHFVSHAAGGRAVPAFHRLNGPAIANLLSVDRGFPDRLHKGRRASDRDLVFTGQLNAERSDVLAEIFHRLERRDAGQFDGFGHHLVLHSRLREFGLKVSGWESEKV